uniref:Uncharacterized AAA domain-containing protein ycf46 n=1 Tax=Membranoptera platyphylla TaxID=1204437 RepID=A0A1I9KQH2_9FLOR|nr:AAA domain-containing protein Ycf46 [Membranoptera platyphylla]AMJ16867.1 AAA domain-containing protein Ycf46 [Membranoptera platyphylla]
MNFEQEIQALLSSKNFLIYILTEEEERLEYNLNYISKKIFQQNLCTWDFIDGYNNNPNYKNKAQKNPLQALENIQKIEYEKTKIFLFKDFNFFINDFSIIRKLKNLNKWLQLSNKYIFISSSDLQMPNTLKEYITLIRFPLPNQLEIKRELARLYEILQIKYHIPIENLAIAYKGFSINRIRQSTLKIALNKQKYLDILENILKEKQQIIQQTNILEFYKSHKNLNDIAGLKNLKKWLKIRKNAFSQQASNYGISIPKGILLLGIQGTGKSLSAKAISAEWQIPLLKLDVSKIFAGILGESENKIKKMIDICEQIAPCILWIDEIDKIFNTQNNNTDSGTTNRVNSIFLTWLSERNSRVFIVATANDLTNLPIEMLRKGRFDEIFFVNLPDFKERINIFQIHLKKVRPLTWYKYNIYYLSQISENFSGAEIEQAINEAMYNAFYDNREFITLDIIYSLKVIIPLAFTHETNLLKLQRWIKSGKIRLA